MSRVKLHIPKPLPFTTRIPVRIQDINYGGHLGHDALISILQEARVQFLQTLHCTELDACGTGLIMGYLSVVYLAEGHYGDQLEIGIGVSEMQGVSFELCYAISAIRSGSRCPLAEAITGMVSFDYARRKVQALPEALKIKLEPYRVTGSHG